MTYQQMLDEGTMPAVDLYLSPEARVELNDLATIVARFEDPTTFLQVLEFLTRTDRTRFVLHNGFQYISSEDLPGDAELQGLADFITNVMQVPFDQHEKAHRLARQWTNDEKEGGE